MNKPLVFTLYDKDLMDEVDWDNVFGGANSNSCGNCPADKCDGEKKDLCKGDCGENCSCDEKCEKKVEKATFCSCQTNEPIRNWAGGKEFWVCKKCKKEIQ